jgi:hypothetical protein
MEATNGDRHHALKGLNTRVQANLGRAPSGAVLFPHCKGRNESECLNRGAGVNLAERDRKRKNT